jgi:hypothetical protein
MDDLSPLTVPDLLRLHASILDELRKREILRSANGPSGDYGELLFCKAFGWHLEGKSSSGHDATDDRRVRYQIKCRRITPQNKSRQLSFIRNLPSKPFDMLAGVLLDQDFRVLRAALVPFDVVHAKATFTPHVNAWRLILRDTIWAMPGVCDVTDELRAAELTL